MLGNADRRMLRLPVLGPGRYYATPLAFVMSLEGGKSDVRPHTYSLTAPKAA